MRLITFTRSGSTYPEIGARIPNSAGDLILPFADVAKKVGVSGFPGDMRSFLRAGSSVMDQAKSWVAASGDHTALLIIAKNITYLPPITDAEKFLCVGKNYRTHLEELKRTNLIKEIPQEPTSFIKLNSCLTGHEAKVVRPKGITRLDYEPELVFVMGKRALGAKKAEAMDYIAGVTILNDLTCRDLQLREVASG
jgi:5-carboxymethyl-2-hydroxymuconate isomerase/acylpyruvate hydrolase